jgi:hypothetical protein
MTALRLQQLLRESYAVAVGFRVFDVSDPSGRYLGTNWTNTVTQGSGRVVDEFSHRNWKFTPTKMGHAVCVLGYRSAPKVAGGGFFVFRNSWGSQWASTSAEFGELGGPRYGIVSAEYVNKYANEAGYFL